MPSLTNGAGPGMWQSAQISLKTASAITADFTETPFKVEPGLLLLTQNQQAPQPGVQAAGLIKLVG